jgi:hypothetical protein
MHQFRVVVFPVKNRHRLTYPTDAKTLTVTASSAESAHRLLYEVGWIVLAINCIAEGRVNV